MNTQDDRTDFEDVVNLLLDPGNPRLPSSLEREQPSMLNYIAHHFSIVELMQAIGTNGYFIGEPLLIAPAEDSPGKFLVVEGNRRLTAVKLLTDPKAVGKRSVHAAAEDASERPSRLPVIRFDCREDIVTYLGNRHIVGVKSWSSLSKARYLMDLYESLSDLPEEDRFRRLARQIGSRRDYVSRTLVALAVYQQIEQVNFFDLSGLDETNLQFSVFYSALSRPDFRSFIELSDGLASAASVNMERLKELTEYICVRVGASTVLKNPQNLSKLGEVLQNSKALEILRRTQNLDRAFSMTTSFQSVITDLVQQALESLTAACSAMEAEDPPRDRHELEGVTQMVGDICEKAPALKRKWQELMGEE